MGPWLHNFHSNADFRAFFMQIYLFLCWNNNTEWRQLVYAKCRRVNGHKVQQVSYSHGGLISRLSANHGLTNLYHFRIPEWHRWRRPPRHETKAASYWSSEWVSHHSPPPASLSYVSLISRVTKIEPLSLAARSSSQQTLTAPEIKFLVS